MFVFQRKWTEKWENYLENRKLYIAKAFRNDGIKNFKIYSMQKVNEEKKSKKKRKESTYTHTYIYDERKSTTCEKQ